MTTGGHGRLRLLGLLPLMGGRVLAGLLAVHVLAVLTPAATAVATGWLLTRTLREGTGADMVLPLAAVAALVLAGRCLLLGREPLDELAARRVDGRLRAELRRQVGVPRGLSHLDEEEYATAVARVSELGGWRRRTPGTGVVGQLALAARLTGAALCAAVLATYSPVLAVGLLAVTLVMRATIRRQWLRLGRVWDAHAGSRRRMDYWADTLSEVATAKEVRLYGVRHWLADRHAEQARGWLDEIWAHRRGILRRQWWTFLLAGAAGFAALYVPGLLLSDAAIDYGDLITMVLAAWGVFEAGAMGHEAFDIEYASGAMTSLDGLRARAAADGAHPGGRAAPVGTPHIRFEDVRFAYPGHDRPVLTGLDLDIRPGEVLAVVGENGAGKTTMLKLLAALQEPTGGRITVDGQDLAELDVDGWRRRISTVFQDFLRYPLTARQNIALGAPEAPADDESVLRAAEAGGARELIERLPLGLDTLLTREHTGGVDLSGGQWQKIAIARAMFAVAAGRRVLVLDEPTAHLDVRAETEFYDEVISAVSGMTVVLISHRLSTVRRADRVVLLAGGRVVEEGSHEELMALDKRYAYLYRLQADRFTADQAAQVDGAQR
ncbi:ABC transporter ATP-binding protein [Actinokineospora globicatena]|nr:ABC transporter ATP-binding protein [Actinokineospora globicatena]